MMSSTREFKSIQTLLEYAAVSQPSNGLIIYSAGNPVESTKVLYSALLAKSRWYSVLLRAAKGFRKRAPIAIYLDGQLNTILWFWATLFADAIPVIIPPLSNIPEQRKKLIQAFADLFDDPIWITTSQELNVPDIQDDINILAREIIWPSDEGPPILNRNFWSQQIFEGDAMFMLTSGSTGTPKAARLSHCQILAALHGKLALRPTSPGKPFLNWIGFDHVASVVEIHLTAMLCGVDQIHISAPDLIADPLLFIELLSRHQVTRTFAPNFFLAKLVKAIVSGTLDVRMRSVSLSHLTWLGSGGEGNEVEICVALEKFMTAHDAQPNTIVPGFGMTETGAGCVYHLECPSYDIAAGTKYTFLGKCIPASEMRICRSKVYDQQVTTKSDDEGTLEIRGPAIFEGYWKNHTATAEVFAPDGWFRTGDRAMIDVQGNLLLIGRAKETMILNGVKYFPEEIESILFNELASSLSRIFCFSYRPEKSHTEHICVIYVLNSLVSNSKSIAASHDAIVRAVMLHTGSRPQVISLEDESQLQATSLGKVSKAKVRNLFENGLFLERALAHDAIVREQRQMNSLKHADDTEQRLLDIIYDTLDVATDSIEVETTIFDVGVTSIDLIRLKRQIEVHFDLDIPVATILTNPTARSLATTMKYMGISNEYTPVVTLKRRGTKTPLWLVHPGVGEVLVFLGLVRHLDDRPVYALRARGFDGQPYFSSLEETIVTYYRAIKQQQPEGPYAVTGYSFGAMLAFEICKLLERDNIDHVKFFGSFNLPPHIKSRMQQLGWKECLLHLCYFLDLITEDLSEQLLPTLRPMSIDEAFDHVFGLVDRARLQALSIESDNLRNWASLAHGLQHMAVEYEPSGSVSSIDVFYAEPLKAVAQSKEEWVGKSLSRWTDFCATQPRFHEVGGAHYTMLNSDHVVDFSKILKEAMQGRGL